MCVAPSLSLSVSVSFGSCSLPVPTHLLSTYAHIRTRLCLSPSCVHACEVCARWEKTPSVFESVSEYARVRVRVRVCVCVCVCVIECGRAL
jgi:hypothetical protein